MIRSLAVGAAAAATAAAAWAGLRVVRDAHARGGVDPVESVRPMPGDDLVAEPDAVDTRVIDIGAPVEAVWPWLVQMGYGRAGWYSYDVFDMDVPSALSVEQRWQSLAVGDVMPTHPEGGFVVRELEAPRAMVLYLDRALVEEQEHDAQRSASGRPAGIDAATSNVRATGAYLSRTVQGEFAASWAFQLEPRGEGASRLVERFRVRMEAPPKARRVMGVARGALGFGVFVMTRRHMLGVKDRAEGRFGPTGRSFPIHPGGHDAPAAAPLEAQEPPEAPAPDAPPASMAVPA
jgi:hypothetical protein